jgi:hypothetical protein
MSDAGVKLFVFSLFGLGFGTILFFSGFKRYKEKKLIENTPTSKIRSIAMGRVEIAGKVLADKNHLIKSPFSNNDCVYCKWTVEEYKRSGKNSSWVTVKTGVLGKYFFVQDDTGVVLVDPTGAKVEIPMDYELDTGLGRSPSEYTKRFLEGQDVSYKGFIFNKHLRFREYFLAHNDPVYVMGVADDNPFVEEASSQKNEADIMIQKGPKDSFYYITDKKEKDVLTSYNWKVIGSIFGGGGLIIICLFYIFLFLGIL